jgi:hypothetical protein
LRQLTDLSPASDAQVEFPISDSQKGCRQYSPSKAFACMSLSNKQHNAHINMVQRASCLENLYFIQISIKLNFCSRRGGDTHEQINAPNVSSRFFDCSENVIWVQPSPLPTLFAQIETQRRRRRTERFIHIVDCRAKNNK